MTKTEMPVAQPDFSVPECGTPTTPPCPLAAFYQERNNLIYEISGRGASRRRIEEVSEQVDHYLITSLHGARVLLLNTRDKREPGDRHEPHPSPK